MRGADRATARLLLACERAKRALSVSTKAFIELDALYDDDNVKSTVARTRYEGFLCGDLLRRMMHPVEKVLRDAKVAIFTVDEVAVVGGLAYIPKVRKLLTGFFHGKTLSKPVRPARGKNRRKWRTRTTIEGDVRAAQGR
ncbi:70-kilodalton heat shock protein [Phytophthora pseudosyringae]|uniref:70-kilodalton heat shock protein n=1 Tax=Phytophthora pseudosyringae TaxID=221518 RepID=A0A8T1VUE9_9STRA|nr:70-kilodalton heat shock protein [Phytophthora pseudosyringae]